MSDRRQKIKRKKTRKKARFYIIIGVVFFSLFVYGRNIIILSSQNRALKQEQKELIEQRDDLKEKLKSVNSKDYIKEQARKQLRLLDPDEKIFLYEEENSKNKQTSKDDDKSKD